MRQLELENDKKVFRKVSSIICRVKAPFFHEVTESLLLIRMASQNVLRTAAWSFFSKQDPHVSGGTSCWGGGGHSLIWPIRLCAADQGIVFRVLSLEKGVFLDWKPFNDCKTWHERSTFEIPIIFSLSIGFHDFSVKNYLLQYAKQNKWEGQKVVSPVLNRVAKWAIFVLNRVGVWRPRRHIFTQTFLEPLPPGGGGGGYIGLPTARCSG